MTRSSSLYWKGLIAIGEQEQERGPDLTTNDIGDTVAANDVCFTRKSGTKQNPNPNESDGGII
jgi:hypothetical protein